MKLTIPLSVKVSLWLLLNLLLLALVGMVFFFIQARLGWNSIVAEFAGERLQSISLLVGGELRIEPRSNWDAVLARFSAIHGVEFTLFREDGRQLAGASVELPESVIALLRDHPPRPPPRPLLAGESLPGRPEGWKNTLPIPGSPSKRAALPVGRFMQRAGDPPAYWIGIRMPGLGPTGVEGPPDAGMLLARASTFWATATLLDLKPLFLGAAVMLVISILFWLPMVGGMTRSLRQLSIATESIAEGRFETRVATRRRDELGALGVSVNRMAARLHTLVHGQKRFLGDVAHELGGPLSRLQMATSILEDRVPSSLQGAVTDVREEVQHMSALVNELLEFTRAGLRARDVVFAPVRLEPLIDRVIEREDAGECVVRSVPIEAVVLADAALLERALGNLVRNALRYAGDAGRIELAVRREGESVLIALHDEGPGVPAEALARLGEPFYRPDSARTREAGGVGLGLAIVRTCMEACRGTVTFRNREPRGFSAEMRLPAAS